MDWFNHAHADFLKSEDNKYFKYADQQENLAAKGKSRAKCLQDHVTGAANTDIGDCDGSGTASFCKEGHHGTAPVTDSCDQSQTRHPTAVPTYAPTAIGHDGWGGLKFGTLKHRQKVASEMNAISGVLGDLAAISHNEHNSAEANALDQESGRVSSGAGFVAQDLRMV